MRYYIFAAALLLASSASAHEMTPTYPVLKPAYMDGVVSTKMTLFNKRQDINYYQVDVFDADWKAIPFVTTNKIINISYLGKTDIEIYIRNKDVDRVEYICTTSKLLKDDPRSTGVMSKICSRVK